MTDNTSNEKLLIETGIGPMTDNLINIILKKIASKEFKGMLANKIVDPSMKLVYSKVKPYIYASVVMYVTVIILLLMIYHKISK